MPAPSAEPFGPPPSGRPVRVARSPSCRSRPRARSGDRPPPTPASSQFLRQGDEAAARGHLQEAIDLWSRVFLIDLSNDEASRRIDATREKQNEAARQLDVLLSEGVQLYEAGDLQSARNAFLKVLTLSESDATARNYLNQIDAALVAVPAAAAVPSARAGGLPDEPYMRDELESPVRPSFADDLPSLDERAGGRVRPRGGPIGSVAARGRGARPAAARSTGGS